VGPGTRRAVSVWYVEPMALTLRTDDELERALDLLCEQEGLSRQELIRRAVLERLERSGHRERVDAAAVRAVSRWGDVLDRLGTV
jgi:predicted transcriptional regulator